MQRYFVIPHTLFPEIDPSGYNNISQETISMHYKQRINDIAYPCFASIASTSSQPINKENISIIDPEEKIEYFVQIDNYSLPFSLGVFNRMDKDRENIEKIIQAFQIQENTKITKELFFQVIATLIDKEQIDLLFLFIKKIAAMQFERNKIRITELCGLFSILEKHGIPLEKLAPIFSQFDVDTNPLNRSERNFSQSKLIEKFSNEPSSVFFSDLRIILSGISFAEVKKECSIDQSNSIFQQCITTISSTISSLNLRIPLELIIKNNYFPKEPLYQFERAYLLTILKNGSEEQLHDAIEALYKENDRNITNFNKIVQSSKFLRPFIHDLKKEIFTPSLPKSLIIKILVGLDRNPSIQNALYAVQKMIEDTSYQKELFTQIKDVCDRSTITSNCVNIISTLHQSSLYAYYAEIAPQDIYIEKIIDEIEQGNQNSLLFPLNIGTTTCFILYKKNPTGNFHLTLYQENNPSIMVSPKNNIKDKETWDNFYKMAESSTIETAFTTIFGNGFKANPLSLEYPHPAPVIESLLSYVETELIKKTSFQIRAKIQQMLSLYFVQGKKELDSETDLSTISIINDIEKVEKEKAKAILPCIQQWVSFFKTFESDIDGKKQHLIRELQKQQNYISQQEIPISPLRFIAIALTLPKDLIKPFFEHFTYFEHEKVTLKDKEFLSFIIKCYPKQSAYAKIAEFLLKEPSKDQKQAYIDAIKCTIDNDLVCLSKIVIHHGHTLSITPFDSFYLKTLFQFEKSTLTTLSTDFEKFSSLYLQNNSSALNNLIISLPLSRGNQLFQILQGESQLDLAQKYTALRYFYERENDPQKSGFHDAIVVNFFLDRHTFSNRVRHNAGLFSSTLAVSKDIIDYVVTEKNYPAIFDSTTKDTVDIFFKNTFLPLLSQSSSLAFSTSTALFFQAGKRKLMELEQGQSMLIPFRTSNHSTLLLLEKKNSDTVTLTLYNTGLGIGKYHEKKGNFFQTFITIEEVPISNFMELTSWEKIINLWFSPEIDQLYSVFFDILGRNGKVLPPSQDKEDYVLSQQHGSCSYQSIFHCMRHRLTKEPFKSKKEAIAVYKEMKSHLLTHIGSSEITSPDVKNRTQLKELKIKKRNKLLTRLGETEEQFIEANRSLNNYRKRFGFIEKEKQVPESPFERYQRLEKTIKKTLKALIKKPTHQIPLIQDEHPILDHLVTRYAYKKWADKTSMPKSSELKISLLNFNTASLEEKISFLLHDYELEA